MIPLADDTCWQFCNWVVNHGQTTAKSVRVFVIRPWRESVRANQVKLEHGICIVCRAVSSPAQHLNSACWALVHVIVRVRLRTLSYQYVVACTEVIGVSLRCIMLFLGAHSMGGLQHYSKAKPKAITATTAHVLPSDDHLQL